MKPVSKLPHWPPRFPGIRGYVHWQVITRVLCALAITAILATLVFTHLDYYQLGARLEQFRVGQPAPQDIVTNTLLRWDDPAETRRQREEAANQAPTVFMLDQKAADTARAQLDDLFTALNAPENQQVRDATVLDKVPTAAQREITALDAASRHNLHRDAQQVLMDVMRLRIEEGNTEAADLHIQQLSASRATEPATARLLTLVTQAVVRPTWIIDAQRTKDRQQEARDAVAPVVRTLRHGDIVIRKGDTVSTNDLAQLTRKHLLTPAPILRLLPFGVIILFAVIILGLYLWHALPAIYRNDRKILLLACLILAAIWATVTLGGKDEYLLGLMAIPAAAMAITGLLGMPVAVAATMLLSITVGLVADHQYVMVVLTMGSSLTGIIAISSIWPARRAIQAVSALIVVNFLLLVSMELMIPESTLFGWDGLAHLALNALASGLGATILAVGSIYLLARPFGITTHYRLMELSNPNEPLLRKMMLEAPGSYHSSVMVANIAEAAADAIGVNALLTRVAALYHDIGKLKRPGFFVENQAPLGIENMHQRLSPKLSYLILTSHVKDGVELAHENKLPEEVATVIREHHGTTLAAYFYHRAVSEAGGEAVSEHEFRYPGPKPSTREAAVVMLSDSVQASVKSIKEPTPSRIESMVQSIIDNRLQDGQLEDCDITLRDLRRLAEVFTRILTGLYTYTRIEYPEMKNEGTRPRANTNSTTTPATSEPTAAAPGG